MPSLGKAGPKTSAGFLDSGTSQSLHFAEEHGKHARKGYNAKLYLKTTFFMGRLLAPFRLLASTEHSIDYYYCSYK